MTTRPELYRGSKRGGVAALALFALLAWVFWSAEFPAAAGFESGVSITASIGYAMFDLPGEVQSEGFLAAFEIVDVVLVAALVGAVMLARRRTDELPDADADREGGR